MEKLKVLYLVKMNNSVAFVLNRDTKFIHKKLSSNTIVGEDEFLLQTYGFENSSGSFKSFAGRKFELKMEDGSLFEGTNNWWDSVTNKAQEYINDKVCMVAINDIENLCNCYVFCGSKIRKSDFEKLVNDYNGKVYEYREFEDLIIKPIKAQKKDEYRKELYAHIISKGFKDIGKGKFQHPNGTILIKDNTNRFGSSDIDCHIKKISENIFGNYLSKVYLINGIHFAQLKNHTINFYVNADKCSNVDSFYNNA